MLLVVWLFVLTFYFDLSNGALEANEVLMDCDEDSGMKDVERTSPPYHTVGNCNRKIRIFLNITNTGKTPDTLDYSFLRQIADATTGAVMYLLNPVVLRLRQNQVLIAYPFHYLSAVNGKASEIVVNYENTKNYTGCDDSSQVNPTCGLAHDRGKVIPFSAGFCCFCPSEPVPLKQTRGGQDCSLEVGDVSDLEKQKYKASAHCLKHDFIWYTVSALSAPTIFHETFIQVYNQKHLANGSSVWVALTGDEDYELSVQNPYQYDQNKTVAISYLTSKPAESLVTLPYKERRLLTPQQIPGVEMTNLPDPIKNGATDFLLLPKDQIKPEGDVCDVSGVSYDAFFHQPDRCSLKKDTCLQNQPLNFWEKDDARRKLGGKGEYLLERFGIPGKDPIIIDPVTREHYLGLEYYAQHTTVLTIEINADELSVLAVGKYAQVSQIVSASSKSRIDVFVTLLNRGLMPARFEVQVVKCGYGVADSGKESVLIPPQVVESVALSLKPGQTVLTEAYTCTVVVLSESGKVKRDGKSSNSRVAEREVKVNPLDRCICNLHCQCTCMLDKSLECTLVKEEEFHAAGFQGSLPTLTAKPPKHSWILKHPFLALLTLILLLFLFGFIKGVLGLAGIKKIGTMGMDKCLYQPRVINRYQEPDLRNVKVIYDEEGYPIHPDTKERVRVIGEEWLFVFNIFICFFWPCLKSKDTISKVMKKRKEKSDRADEDQDAESPTKKSKHGKSPDRKKAAKERKADKKKSPKDKASENKKSPTDEATDRKKSPTDEAAEKKKPVPDEPPIKKSTEKLKFVKPPRGHVGEKKEPTKERAGPTAAAFTKGPQDKRRSISDNTLKTTGPIAEPLNKEQEKWKKEKRMIQAVTK